MKTCDDGKHCFGDEGCGDGPASSRKPCPACGMMVCGAWSPGTPGLNVVACARTAGHDGPHANRNLADISDGLMPDKEWAD